ncbi:nickel-dependent hydrogenase large subunit [Pseudoroseomonas globiformis]|uniref:Nickel-dependent hydrogenase large subunit n=1 Tax=Teichococcus globiformis TaxID=2307229 RepID=A0ABV7FU93_9PROT
MSEGLAMALIGEGTARTGFRRELSVEQWARLPQALRAEPELELLGLWAENGAVHAAFRPASGGAPLLATLAVTGDAFPALSPARPGARLFERAIADLWGLRAEGGVDSRPWLDHGRWGVAAPLSPVPRATPGDAPQPVFLPGEGEGVHQVPVGPIHAGVIEPGHFRFHVQGETVLRLEARLGYAHKGVLGLMRGRTPRQAARFAARISGDSTVAHSWAFAAAAEAAAGIAPPPRALLLRGLMAELERVANHLNDWGFLCNDAAFAWPHARCGALREALLRAQDGAFGHRLMMDRVVPGGVSIDIAPSGPGMLREALSLIAAELPVLRRVTEDHASLQDRLSGTGVVRAEWARLYAAGGYVGRGSGRDFDARRDLAYPPYGTLDVPVREAGDVEARLAVRIAELEEALRLATEFLDRLSPGDILTVWPQPPAAGEGLAVIEGFRGETFCWMALDEAGLIRACFPRDPSWLHWPLLEAAMEGNILAEFPLCNKSINASYSGVDL